MTNNTLVTSLEESTGKTAITLALARLAADAGDTVGYMKPKGTRLESNVGKTVDKDPMLARAVLDIEADMHDMEPIVYSPTFIEQAIRGREDPTELRARVRDAYEILAREIDHMFLEGARNLETGGIVDLTDDDIASLVDATVVLIAPYDVPGDVDDLLSAATRLGENLSGVVFNKVTESAFDHLETDVIPFLEARDVPVFGAIPVERSLAGVTIRTLADELGAQVLVEDGIDQYVERFSVGAMGADSALRYFRRTKNAAVITGGDRAEIHTVALEAPGIRCLILTGGHRPSGTITGEAAKRNVPILHVQTDTLTTVERAEDVVRSGRTRDHKTVDQMETLLSEHVDVSSILDG